jgi:hypothetical protein
MEELLEYRQNLLNKLSGSTHQLESSILAAKDPMQPLESGGWNMHQVITHMRDVNKHVYLPRLHLILEQDNPMFEDFDAEAWMIEHYAPGEAMGSLVSQFGEQCQACSNWLGGLPVEAWNRPGKHPTLGTHSLQWWVERLLAHISEHIRQLSHGNPNPGS